MRTEILRGCAVVLGVALMSAGPGLAQTPPASSLAPPRLGAPPATAGPTPGITVVGRSTVSVPPDRLRVIVRLTPRGVNDAQIEGLAESVAAAMRTGGVADAAVVLPLAGYLGSQSMPAVVGSVRKPTRQSLETIVRATLKALPDATALALVNAYQVQTSYAVDDCSAAETRAQIAAIADARARAARIASAAGLALGNIVSVNESATFAQAACTGDPDTFAQPISNEDPYGSLAVPIAVSASVTFAVRP